MLGEKARAGHHVVVDEDDHVLGSSCHAGVARGGRTRLPLFDDAQAIGNEEPPHSCRRPVVATIANYDHLEAGHA